MLALLPFGLADRAGNMGREEGGLARTSGGPVITRIGSLLLLIYLLGFVFFAFTLGRPAPAAAPPTDAAVVLTGGPGRIEHGVDVLQGSIRRSGCLSTGVDPAVTKADLARRVAGSSKWLACCVDLGSESVDTRSNAEEGSAVAGRGTVTSRSG